MKSPALVNDAGLSAHAQADFGCMQDILMEKKGLYEMSDAAADSSRRRPRRFQFPGYGELAAVNVGGGCSPDIHEIWLPPGTHCWILWRGHSYYQRAGCQAVLNVNATATGCQERAGGRSVVNAAATTATANIDQN